MIRDLVMRRATVDDAAALAEIHMEARAAAMSWLAVVHTPDEVFQYFRHVVIPGSDVWLAASPAGIAGFSARLGNELDHLYVAVPFWRQGVGAALLKMAMLTVPRLQLWTFQRNSGARQFYEGHGFTAVAFTDGTENEEREPDVRYRWEEPYDHA
tara:strand:- start:73377 stop:73841 length:465 start_codon:yes stop_codon:yes gene_type:complete